MADLSVTYDVNMGVKRAERRRAPRLSSEDIADWAWANVTCPACKAEPKSACCPLPEPPRTVCRDRFIAAAIVLKNEQKAATQTRKAAEAATRLDIANERGVFMADVPLADVRARLG